MDDLTPLTVRDVLVSCGQYEDIDDDGVTTAPVVGLTLVDHDDHEHTFTLSPEQADELGRLVRRAAVDAERTYRRPGACAPRRLLRLVIVSAIAVLAIAGSGTALLEGGLAELHGGVVPLLWLHATVVTLGVMAIGVVAFDWWWHSQVTTEPIGD